MRFSLALFALAAMLPCATAQELSQPSVFGTHMVMQADADVPFWGTAAPEAAVELRGGWWKDAVTTQADADGAWMVRIPAPGPGGPYSIEVVSGDQSLRYEDVLLGEVWVCGGQSNMEWTLGPGVGPGIANWEEEVAGADFPQIRFFDVPHAIAGEPQADAGGEWKITTPENAGRFSAVGYLFGRQLHGELKVPVGLLGCNWGGTVAEAWTSREALEAFGEFENGLAQVAAMTQGDAGGDAAFRARQDAWWKGLAGKDPGSGDAAWYAVQPSDAGPWQTVNLPGQWESGPIGAFDGIVWYRRTIEISEAWVGQDLRMSLGPIDDYDTTWVNGVQVGAMHEPGNWQTPRQYDIPASVVKDRMLTIAVRVLDTGGAGGFAGNAGQMSLEPTSIRGQARRLDGEWLARRGAAIQQVGQPPSRPNMHQNMPTVLHNGMLRSIIPFGMRGAIWYQGESNRTRAYQYRRLFPAMIGDWRRLWGQGDFPFYFVQIAPFNYGGDQGQAAALREAQTLAMRVPQTGMAVTMDIGNPRDIHPKNKQDVADRLARWALAKTYGMDGVDFSGPILAGFRAEEGRMRLWFDHAENGLESRDGEPLSHFQIAGADRVFRPATATVEQHEGRWTLVVRSEAVAEPRAVRYAWGTADEPNLVDTTGLPAPSFRTDSWPAWPNGPVR
ncbi:MAG: glycosyl hydrolase family 2 [Planctomycetes bacterium]|nr:glycosyl hydrolase family 2 [Planctomycetota bacterium]